MQPHPRDLDPPGRSWLRGGLRLIMRPWVSVLSGALLFLPALPILQPRHDSFTIAVLCAVAPAPEGRTPLIAFAPEGSWDELSSFLGQHTGRVVTGSAVWARDDSSLVFATSRREVTTITWSAIPVGITERALNAALLSWVSGPGARSFPGLPASMREQGLGNEAILWSGWALNGVYAVVVIGFAVSLGWVWLRVCDWVRRTRRRRARESGRCPRCLYDVRSVRDEICPECGTALR